MTQISPDWFFAEPLSRQSPMQPAEPPIAARHHGRVVYFATFDIHD